MLWLLIVSRVGSVLGLGANTAIVLSVKERVTILGALEHLRGE